MQIFWSLRFLNTMPFNTKSNIVHDVAPSTVQQWVLTHGDFLQGFLDKDHECES